MISDLRAQVEQFAQGCGGKVSVCVRDIRNGFDFAFNEDVRIRSASTIKVPILLEALRQARDGELSLEQSFTMSPDVLCDGSGVLTRMHHGLVVTLQDLLTLMIIVSDNSATNLVINTVGISKVNATLRAFGYQGTELGRKMYDWEGVRQGRDNWIVAREAADMMVRVAKGKALGGEWDKLVLRIMGAQQFTKLGLFFPEGILANKTGGLENVVNDFGVVTTKDFSYSIAVFTQDAPLLGEAQIAIGRISKAVFDAMSAGKSC